MITIALDSLLVVGECQTRVCVPRRNHTPWCALATFILLALIGNGCASLNSSAPMAQDSPAPAKQLVGGSPAATTARSSMRAAKDDSSAELEALWRERTVGLTAAPSSGFTLGPGDVLRISVPMISQLTDRTVRVSEDDTIALPLLGTVRIKGMTEQDLREDLSSRLGRYMYNTQV
jgi:hypothetical protein